MTDVYKSDAARVNLRRILEAARTGRDSVIEHYDTPTAVVIPYEDYRALEDELDDLRAGRRAQAAYSAWQRNPGLGRPWNEARAELLAEGDVNAGAEPCYAELQRKLAASESAEERVQLITLMRVFERLSERYSDSADLDALCDEIKAIAGDKS